MNKQLNNNIPAAIVRYAESVADSYAESVALIGGREAVIRRVIDNTLNNPFAGVDGFIEPDLDDAA